MATTQNNDDQDRFVRAVEDVTAFPILTATFLMLLLDRYMGMHFFTNELGGNQMGAAMGNVMSGIAEALLATAVGILVALPAVIYYNVFQKKGADVEEGAAALGNVVIASMKAGVKPNGAVGKKAAPAVEPASTLAPASNVVEMEA